MRLVVIDASPVGGGPVTHALACAVAELPGAEVTRLRLYDLFCRTCATCTDCTRTGRCTRHHTALDEAIVRLAEAEALIVGTTGHLQAHDVRGPALLERLVGAFGHLRTARGLESPRADASHKRAALICSAPLLLGPLAMLGLLPAGVAGVWRTLDPRPGDSLGPAARTRTRAARADTAAACTGSPGCPPCRRVRTGDRGRATLVGAIARAADPRRRGPDRPAGRSPQPAPHRTPRPRWMRRRCPTRRTAQGRRCAS
jgi:hypothetical protein